MMAKLFFTVGLPASGKTDLARRMLTDTPMGLMIRLNRDDYRRMCLPADYWRRGGGAEEMVTSIQHAAIRALLYAGTDVIVDDTNLNPKHQRRLVEMALECGSDPIRILLTNVPVETCIQRDAARSESERVGAEVIRSMHERWIATDLARCGCDGVVSPTGMPLLVDLIGDVE